MRTSANPLNNLPNQTEGSESWFRALIETDNAARQGVDSAAKWAIARFAGMAAKDVTSHLIGHLQTCSLYHKSGKTPRSLLSEKSTETLTALEVKTCRFVQSVERAIYRALEVKKAPVEKKASAVAVAQVADDMQNASQKKTTATAPGVSPTTVTVKVELARLLAECQQALVEEDAGKASALLLSMQKLVAKM